ncbi:MAG: penicillin-binding transpeptidase domain-containing protein [Flavobacteriaceae bacterium]
MDKQEQNLMWRFYLVVLVMFVFAVGIAAKIVVIQWVEGPDFEKRATAQTLKNVPLRPSRGNIYASDGSILATSVPRYEVRWDAATPSAARYEQNKVALAEALAAFLAQPQKDIQQKLNQARQQNNRYWLVARGLSYSQMQKVKSFPLFRDGPYKGGLIVEQSIVREHPMGKIAERTIGYEKRDPDGTFIRVGLEGAYFQYLSGEEGSRLKQKIANGQWKPINTDNEKEPTEGYDLYTTIDINMQDIAQNALLKQLEDFEAEHGTVVLMEVQTGAVKAIANLGRTSEGFYYEKLNYAVGESHEPGSTFKTMAMVAALEDQKIEVDTPVETGNGKMQFFGKYDVKDSKRGGYGTITAGKALEVSSNVGLVKIVYENYKDNPKQFVDRLYNMGLNKPLGLPIKGEGLPKIPYPDDKNEWDGLDLPWMAYGYGVSLTPLQTLTFYNAIANDGVMVKPKFLNKISNLGDTPKQVFEVELLNPSICSESTLTKVRQMLFNVVDKKWGTAHQIKDPFLTMAGKTGTCQVDYSGEAQVQYISSFVGYFPADAPRYSCIVVIHRPNKAKGYYGATVAAPVFKAIAKKVYNTTPQKAVLKKEQLQQLLATPKPTTTVPDVLGLKANEAIDILKEKGWRVEIVGKGQVVSQQEKANGPNKASTIILTLS